MEIKGAAAGGFQEEIEQLASEAIRLGADMLAIEHMDGYEEVMNVYVRFRLALTEPEPMIKSYDNAAWAELADARSAPVEVSLALFEALHQRWVPLLVSMTSSDFVRTFRRPDSTLR
jgi:hypothetical protein